jgi:hypothetical protein
MLFRVLSTAAFLLVAARAQAQVGHPPESSPYREILYGNSLMGFAGSIGGIGGNIGIGPHDGITYGGRFDHRLSNVISVGISFETGAMDRLIVDADDPVDSRVKGPVSQQLSIVDAILQFNITGKKTWHGLAPYVGGTIGIAWAEDTPADTSGYHFGTRAALSPGAGFRFFLGKRLHVRGDVRWLFWELKYPSSYFQEPADDPGTIGHSNAVLAHQKDSEWENSTEFRLGVGFAF